MAHEPRISPPTGSRYLVDGEPTDSRLGLGDTWRASPEAESVSGRAAHSSFPELGESAIDKLLDALIALRGIPFADDPVLGRTHYTVGLIAGGVAANVVSPAAEAEVMFRRLPMPPTFARQWPRSSRW